MSTSEFKDNLVIHRSPIEFVVVGPRGKRDGILVRSENPPLDLIGFAAIGRERNDSSGPLGFFFPSLRRGRYSVESFPLQHSAGEWDERKSGYRFCWVGMCSESDREKIHEAFNRYAADLLSGIQERDIDQVEWSLAPVILHCLEAQTRFKKRRLMFPILLAAYVMALLIALIVRVAMEFAP